MLSRTACVCTANPAVRNSASSSKVNACSRRMLATSTPRARLFASGRLSTSSCTLRTATMAASAAVDEGWTIVGGGRVGEALSKLGKTDDIVRRGETIVDDHDGPIIVCTRNDDLDSVLEATPPHRKEDLVFIQNGMLEPWLAERGLADNTQVLVYFAVAKKGDAPIDGKTDVNPEGLTAAYGKHAQAFADRLATADLSCKVFDKTEFKKSMLEKLIWISAYMLIGVKNEASVGEVESKHKDQVEKLISELAKASSEVHGVQLDDADTIPRLMAYSRSVAHYPTAIKEFPWRNGYFYSLTQQAEKEGRPDPCPFHTQLLKETGSV